MLSTPRGEGAQHSDPAGAFLPYNKSQFYGSDEGDILCFAVVRIEP